VIEVLGALVGIAVGVVVLLGSLWRFVVLPNLREQLTLARETNKQVSQNGHANSAPTVLDRLDDVERASRQVEASVSLLALNVNALMQQLANHTGESTEDRRRLWLIVESLIHEASTDRKHRDNPRNT
jgi:hypothetical protein